MKFLLPRFGAFLCLCMAWMPAIGQVQPPPQAQDQVVLSMAAAYKKGDASALTQLLPRAKGHPLEPWAAYYELSTRLDRASYEEVQTFFKRYANTYVEDRLRADWLLLLGARRDWSSFTAAHGAYRMGDDKDIRCYAAHIQFVRTGQLSTDAITQIERDWMSQPGIHTGCGYAAQNLIDAGKMPAIVAWRKALPQEPSAKAGVAAYRAWQNALTPHPQWSEAQRNWARGVLAKSLAVRWEALSESAFAKVSQPRDLSDEMLAWWVRVLLRADHDQRVDWARIDQLITRMSSAFKSADAAWFYWQAQAKLHLDQKPLARDLLATIAWGKSGVHTGFYELLATQALGGKATLDALPGPAPLTQEERAAARARAGLQRALYAIRLGLRSEGVREWNYETNLAPSVASAQGGSSGSGAAAATSRGMSDRERLAAAQLACEQRVWDRCISTSERTVAFADWTQRYPMPYRQEVQQAAVASGVDLAFLYGLIRQESRFVTDAQSNVGAAGLMQVMPSTARWVAKRLATQGGSKVGFDDLEDVSTNLRLGSHYLRLLLQDFERQGLGEAAAPFLATAAYNAGPARANAWQGASRAQGVRSVLAWIENIPFQETRDYVKKVTLNTKVYRTLLAKQTKLEGEVKAIRFERDKNGMAPSHALP